MQVSEITTDSLLTSHQVGRLLQVSRRSVNNWIEQGRIPAFRTPGGHRRVRVADLMDFLTENDFPVPRGLEGLGKRRVMIVDDDPQQLRSYGRLLAPYADVAEVVLFERGIDALLDIGATVPDVVVLDVMMPGLDGLEVCRRLKANEKCRATDVVICSGNISPAVETEALEAGARVCLRKPIDAETLVRELGLPIQREIAVT